MPVRLIGRIATLALLLAFVLPALVLSGCDNTDTGSVDETTSSAEAPEEANEDPAGVYTGEFGATLELEEGGTLDANVPLTIEVAEDGTAKAMWDYSTEVPAPEVETAATTGDLKGAIEGKRFGASGKGTLTLSGPNGTLEDGFGVVLQGELSYDTIIGTVEFYGETEEFVVTKQ